MGKSRRWILPVLPSVLLLLLLPSLSRGDAGNDYCVTPAFVSANIPANLLLMIDNSASMYDLSSVDQGKKQCSGSGATCTVNSDCPSGQTCNFTREPYYCFDETYSGDNNYSGYFAPQVIDSQGNKTNTYYSYRPATDDFVQVASFPFGCPTGNAGNVSFSIPNTMCVEYTSDKTSIVSFVASGNYLNWLAASKFDVEKKILTGGKYVSSVCSNNPDRACVTDADCGTGNSCNAVTTPFLQAETRGCVGQGFIKQPLTSDFVNYKTSDLVCSNNTSTSCTSDNDCSGGGHCVVPPFNTTIPLVFLVHGPANPNNDTAPSSGGQTYIDLYPGNYNSGNCQAAVNSIATGTNADIKKDVASCLSGSSSTYCQQKPSITGCSQNADCTQTLTNVCDKNYAMSCTSDANCNTTTKLCTVMTSTDCSANSDCTSPATCVNGHCGTVSTRDCTSQSCTVSATYRWSYSSQASPAYCLGTSGSVTITANNKTCYHPSAANNTLTQDVDNGGHVVNCSKTSDCPTGDACLAQGTYTCGLNTPAVNYGTCQSTGGNFGPCDASVTNNYGPCVFNAGTTPTAKAKVAFQQSMQACWQLRNGHPIGIDDIGTVQTQCSSIYTSYATCSNDSSQTCTYDADCSTGNTCIYGPAAIGPGSPALLCGDSWEGQFFYKNSSGSWVLPGTLQSSTTMSTYNAGTPSTPIPSVCSGSDTLLSCMEKVHTAFCNSVLNPNVTDPSDAPSDTTYFDNLPAILSGIGVESQLGSPVKKSIRLRLTPSTPSCTKDSQCPAGTNCMATDGSGGANCANTGSTCVCKPAGIVQQFGNQIRLGAMTFNQFGSASETSSSVTNPVKISTVCDNDPTLTCTADTDCGSGHHCISPTDLDGGQVIYPVGAGYCATMTGVPCNTSADCPALTPLCYNNYCGTLSSTPCTTALTCSGSSQACVRTAVGDHAASGSLVQKLDAVRADAWTPFAETFYNALGYFAAIPQGDGSFKSRGPGASSATGYTPLRLNDSDYDINQQPSEYRCQPNYILLVTDGSSTADQKDTVNGLASLYQPQAGGTAGACTVVSPNIDYHGSSNLPILSWIGRNENLATFATSGTATQVSYHCSATTTQSCSVNTDCPMGEVCTNGLRPRDYVSTYVVMNGADNGATGACDATNLLKNTAANGGTKINFASNPDQLKTALTSVFQNVAAQSSSGTAASILSNSEGSGANILQAVFYPKKMFDDDTSVNWIGEMQNLWYYVDPQISHSTIREDTSYVAGSNIHTLDLVSDKIVTLQFNPTDNTTYAYLQSDTNGDGIADTAQVSEGADDVKSIWRAGRNLFYRNLTLSPRNLKTSINGTSLIDFNSSNASTLAPYLNVGGAGIDATTTTLNASNVIDYVTGNDHPELDWRKRKVTYKGTEGIWRLGDIISSTPRIQSNMRLNSYGLPAPSGYSDASYNSYINSNDYQGRGMVYVGANDGMLHAFNLGTLDVTASGTTKAHLTGSNLGQEQWAYIPKNVLPYLKYYTDPYYNHIYSVDGTTQVVDVSIGELSSCTGDNYYTCPKAATVVDSNNNLNANNTWRTVLVGGMGLGGASTMSCATDADCVQTPLNDPSNVSNGLGYSSYFALDVTNPQSPTLLWEFNDPNLGYATTGPAIVRVGDPTKNGKWFAVFGSGPTGPIDTSAHQFLGRSNQPLKFWAVDIKTGKVTPIPMTFTIDNAFAGSMVGGAIDADRWNPNTTGNYQDDAIYVGYTAKQTSGSNAGNWTDGGVLRIMTGEDIDPAHWVVSKVIEGIGPVTTGISRLQDRKNMQLWLYFGTGRYYSRIGNTIDDSDSQRSIFGLKEPCYNYNGAGNALVKTCTAEITSGITNQTDTITNANSIGGGGWRVDLDEAPTGFGAERVVTDAVALTNGVVFLTSFEPTTDACGFGGNSFMWALAYNSGGRPPDAALGGKALIQLSTGAFQELDLSQVFGAGASHLNRRASVTMTGKPPADAFPVVSKSANRPVKKILHIQER